ncbi:hypothetical protein M406DRAFT_103763 [Cryphonectria parasitica EP155]|uniref:Zn(2)-C6 fungal-type domain-containing protein n=1 Tax=Cryphonectria parasitica (strain ATCC 38755 / EP155) TaxID=660469 RepID=A0A9P4Y0B1_CRYP1|nr:uncharacterized protein M406DRAFT_103763 [Cryphonectria parasitica EP155]KAF3764050.1 hypothetical protein M406DRAFT_103763 [Cryphonectria parasitica EP155]
MADSIRVSLPTSGEDETDTGGGPLDLDSMPTPAGASVAANDTAEDTPRRPQKRRRIPVACGACRSKKSRCDGYRPKCSSCQAQNIECVYLSPPISATTPVPRAFLQLVETRLSQLESDVRMLKDTQSRTGSVTSDSIMNDRRASMSTYQSALTVPEVDSEDFGEFPDATDGMGSMEFAKEEDSGYYGTCQLMVADLGKEEGGGKNSGRDYQWLSTSSFTAGPSSNIAFTRNIRRAMYALLSRPASRHLGPDARSHRQIPHRPSLDVSRPSTPHVRTTRLINGEAGSVDGAVDYLALPPDEEMDALVSRFFVDTGALFPFVHGPSFLDEYERVKRNNFRKFRRSWLGLLNAILTMATVTSASMNITASDRAARAEVFYMRAKALCLDRMLHSASLETVQAMLLLSQYLQGTHRSTTTWNVHGLAVKAAFQLGLHSTSFCKDNSPLDKEMRLRTWYGCILLDRTLSMTFGRPPAIPESYVRTPLPKACDKTLAPMKVNDVMLSTDFFVYTITLYKIMWTIIDILYKCNIGDPDGGVLPVAASILQIEHQLLEWQAALGPLSSLVTPAELRNDDSFSAEKRFRVVLTLRYHNVRILAHRRMLDLYLSSIERGQSYDAEDSMLRQVGQRSKSICFQSASELIGIVNVLTHSPEPKRGLLGAWWFTLYYTFNATLTIVALMLCNHVSGPEAPTSYEATGISDQALNEILAAALACLPLIDNGNKMVEKCAKFATTLNQCLHLLGEQADGSFRSNGEGGTPTVETPRPANQYGVPHSYAPIPIDVSHFDLGALGWENDFLASLWSGMTEGNQESDLFC